MARWEPGARERLVLAAVDLFTEQGYDETTVAQIAERAGVTKSTFFRHFPDKRELLAAGQETLSRLLAEGIAEAPAGHPARGRRCRPRARLQRDGPDEPRARPALEGGGRRQRRTAGAGRPQERRPGRGDDQALVARGVPARPRIWPASWACWPSNAASPSGPRATTTPTTAWRRIPWPPWTTCGPPAPRWADPG